MSTNLGFSDVYEPGQNVTGYATSAVTGQTFLAISGDRTGGNVSVAPATAAGRVFGVARTAAASGQLVSVARGGGRVVHVTAAASITAFAQVQVAAGGQATPLASGVAVGYALTSAASGALAEISLY
ncbi:capsid cement protein [Mycobacterium sp. OTB74]|jgi:hypothetical protein|uniref:capsid cement protein n=1 Tax=Mycobacterium sp. OTB74 TaxID=1853452 RepID=UPI002475D18F|nr:capsid cement protein [Mycobacterium sp. OTB74]MDH6245746.1 hypothetical protein [Mycobacterium sp. OTB74]